MQLVPIPTVEELVGDSFPPSFAPTFDSIEAEFAKSQIARGIHQALVGYHTLLGIRHEVPAPVAKGLDWIAKFYPTLKTL